MELPVLTLGHKASLGILQPWFQVVKTISETNTHGKNLDSLSSPVQEQLLWAGFPSTVYEFVKSGRYPRKGWFPVVWTPMMRSISAGSRLSWCGNTVTTNWLLSGGNERLLHGCLLLTQIFLSLDERRQGDGAKWIYELMHHSALTIMVLFWWLPMTRGRSSGLCGSQHPSNQDSLWRCFCTVHESDQEVDHAWASYLMIKAGLLGQLPWVSFSPVLTFLILRRVRVSWDDFQSCFSYQSSLWSGFGDSN